MAKIDKLFQALQQQGGSDLHLSPGNPPMIRVSGQLKPAMSQVLSSEQYKLLLYEIMSEDQRAEFEEKHDLDFAYEVEALNARFRANIFLGRLGISAVFRIIPVEILTVQQLGLPQTVIELTEYKKGLVLVTGPTGSGKSTTLYSTLKLIATSENNVVTVEELSIPVTKAPDSAPINRFVVRLPRTVVSA